MVYYQLLLVQVGVILGCLKNIKPNIHMANTISTTTTTVNDIYIISFKIIFILFGCW